MLQQDHEMFNRMYPSASQFLLAAKLRLEFLSLCRTWDVGLMTRWQRERLEELAKTPAIHQQEWFLNLPEVKRYLDSIPDGTE